MDPVSIKEIHIFLYRVLRYYLILESFHCGFGGPAGGFGGPAGVDLEVLMDLEAWGDGGQGGFGGGD